MPAEEARDRDLTKRDSQIPDEDGHPDVDSAGSEVVAARGVDVNPAIPKKVPLQGGLGALEADDERLQADRAVVVAEREHALSEPCTSEALDRAFGVTSRPDPAQLSSKAAQRRSSRRNPSVMPARTDDGVEESPVDLGLPR